MERADKKKVDKLSAYFCDSQSREPSFIYELLELGYLVQPHLPAAFR